MPRNVEIKVRVRDVPSVLRRIEGLADGPPQVLVQEDTFFQVPRGRLKLRVLGDGRGELIFYERADAAGPRPSEYHRVSVDAPSELLAVLSRALGVKGTVRKRRLLYRRGRTRIHLDAVENLGSFLELEVEMGPAEPRESGEAEAEALMVELGIEERDRVTVAYVDLAREASA